MEDGTQSLSSLDGPAWTVPLARMSCALDTTYDHTSDTIRCAGGGSGFAVYGPYLSVEPGLYEVEVDIALTGARNPKLHLDLWIEGQVLAKRAVVLDRACVVLRGWVHTASRLEVRAHTAGTGFVIHSIHLSRLDPTAPDAGMRPEAEKASRRQRLRAAIGLAGEASESDGPPIIDLLDEILGEPRFLLLEDTEIPAHETTLRRCGIDPVAIQLLFARNNTRLFEGAGDSRELMSGYPDVTNAFQLDILRDGALTIPSPFGPGVVTSRSSFPVLSPIHNTVTLFYEFAEPHHVIVGVSTSWIGALSFVWFVDHEMLVYDARLHILADSEPTLPILRAFVDLCARHRAQARAYRSAEKTPACISGFITNMGHYFWNEVSGVERVLRAGYRPLLLLADPRWLALRDIFRGDDLPIVAEAGPDRDALFLTALTRNLFLVRPTGNAIDAALASKVGRAASDALQACHPGRSTEIDELSEGAFVLFFNLRAHNKSWIEQVEGAAEVVERLAPEVDPRRILLVLDGYDDCAEIVRAIRGRLAANCRIVDGTGVSFAETLVWAYRCDLFVAVIGSGLVPLTWLAAKPGVCHGDHLHMNQMAFWPLVRPDYDRLIWPLHDDIRNVASAWYSNYSLSPKIISDLASSQLDLKIEQSN